MTVRTMLIPPLPPESYEDHWAAAIVCDVCDIDCFETLEFTGDNTPVNLAEFAFQAEPVARLAGWYCEKGDHHCPDCDHHHPMLRDHPVCEGPRQVFPPQPMPSWW